MKRFLLLMGAVLFISGTAFGQVSVTDASTITIDFSTTVSGVNNGSFAGTGFATSPTAGQLDADAWATTGFSDGSKGFGTANTSGDHARGTSTGGVTSGGLYSFDVGSSDPAIGFQGTGTDFTPGTIILKITNTSGSIITSLAVNYEAWVYNNENRASSLNFSHSSDNSSYTSEASLDLTSTAAEDDPPAWVKTDKSITLSSLTIANGADYYIRWSSDDVSGSGSRDEFAIDDIVLTPTLTAAGAPSKFAVTTINGGSSPSTGTGFDVVIQLQDNSDNPVNATQDTSVTLSVGSGAGAIGGTTTGTISSGSNTVTISGVTYNTAESGVSITATNTGGSLTAGTSSTFEVLAAANTLVLVSAPTTGITNNTLDSFTVEARRSSDSSKDLNYTKSITISKASGTGTLGGTTSATASAGVATFNNLNFNTAGDFTIQAADGSLTSSASATITISDPAPSLLIISGVYDGQVSSQPKGIELFVTADIADLSSYGLGAANNGGGTDGQEFTFPADAASAGDFIYVAASTTGFNTFFGFDVNYTDGDLGINGDDAIELFKDGTVRDVFGDINTDGTGQAWEYEDGWAYRKLLKTATTTFNSSDWTYSGNDGLNNAVNASATTPFPTGTYTNGKFVHITGSAGWRLLSLPIENWDIADISDDTAIQGVTGGSNTSAAANVYTYDASGAWEVPASTSTEIPEGTGIAVYFFNNTTAGSSTLPVTLGASGAEPSSDVVVDLYSGATGRYTLVGNPFAANVDLAGVSANIAMSSNKTFWDNAAGSYTTQSSTGGLIIEPWQGYWVQTGASTAGGQLTYGTNDKTSSASDTTHFDKTNPNSLKELRFSIESSYNTEKNLTLQVADDANEGWDTYDLLKLNSLLAQNVSAAFVGDLEGESVLKGIEAIPSSLDREITIPIMIDLKGESQTLKMSWEGVSGLPEEWSVMLHDYKTEESFDLRSMDTYDFEVIVDGSNEKVNPITILRSSFGQKMKLKSDQTARFGITITPNANSVGNEPGSEVKGFALDQNYPNPFNPTTTINYAVENSGAVTLSVYNLMGQKVAELVNETKSAGSYNVTWNASQAASGMYYYRLEAGGQVLTRKMTLIK